MLARVEIEKEELEIENILLEKTKKKLVKENRDLQKKHEKTCEELKCKK